MFFVGKLGRNAIATVGLTESVITVVYSLSFGLSTGATAIVARRIGEANHEGAAHAGAQSFFVALSASVILSVAGIVYGGEILSLMGANEEVVRDGAVFTRIMFGGSLAIILLFLINGIFRGAGDPAMAMRSLWIASGINILLCPSPDPLLRAEGGSHCHGDGEKLGRPLPALPPCQGERAPETPRTPFYVRCRGRQVAW